MIFRLVQRSEVFSVHDSLGSIISNEEEKDFREINGDTFLSLVVFWSFANHPLYSTISSLDTFREQNRWLIANALIPLSVVVICTRLLFFFLLEWKRYRDCCRYRWPRIYRKYVGIQLENIWHVVSTPRKI